jgi:hypothetical protein
MNKKILNQWVNGWSLQNIALHNKVTIDQVTKIIREGWGGL